MIRTRKCAVTGEVKSEPELIRFALGPDEAIVPDVAAKLPGRGVWLTADKGVLDQAQRKNAFARSLKCAVTVPSDLSRLTEELLVRRCLDFLGLALRSGGAAVGSVQVEEAIRRAPPFWLIEASDGSEDGRAKLAKLHFGLWGEEPRVSACFTASEMGVALGRAPVVHLALLRESLAQRWSVDVGRLAGFRAITPPSWR